MRSVSYGVAGTLFLALVACSQKADTTRGGAGADSAAGGSSSGAKGGSGGSSGDAAGGSTGGSLGGTAGSESGGTSGEVSAAGNGSANTGGSGPAAGSGTGASGGAGGSGGRPGGGAGQGGRSGNAGGSAGSGTAGGGGRPGGGAGGASSAGTSSGGDAGDSGSDCDPNDEFAGSTLDPCWQILNGSASIPLIELAVADGSLDLSANGSQNGVWYNGSTKSLVYQVVTSTRFKLTTSARPRKATDAEALPTKDLHVGGIMVRDPSSMGGNSENYVFMMVGHSENNNGVVHQGVEFKSTFNGCSNWDEPDWGTSSDEPDAELRICRLGAEFRHYKRIPGSPTWTIADAPTGTCSGNMADGGVLTRNDMPYTVQVGLALNFNAPSDLSVGFDYIHYETLPNDATADDCTID